MKTNISSIILELNSVCNNNCIYCYLKKRGETGKNSLDFFKEKISEYSEKKVKNIDFTGGEPTLYKHLDNLVSVAKRKGFENLNLVTNGRTLSDFNYCRNLIHNGINCVIISVDGPNQEINDAITRTAHSFNHIMKAFKNLHKLNCRLGATIVVNTKNYQYIYEIIKLCLQKGADFINIQFMLPYIKDTHIDCQKIPSSVIPSYNETKKYILEALEDFGDKTDIKIHFIPFCYMEGYENFCFSEANKLDRIAINYRGFEYNIGSHLQKATLKTNKCHNCDYHKFCIGFFNSYTKELGTNLQFNEDSTIVPEKNSKTLFFKNLFVSPEGKENNNWFHQATFYLASSLTKNNKPIIISDSQFSPKKNKLLTKKEELDNTLNDNPDINLIVLTLLENCFEKTRELIKYLKKRTSAFIALGGIMPTQSPHHVMEHIREADLVIRGEGDEVLIEIQKILNGKFRQEQLEEETIHKIKNLKGILLRTQNAVVASKDFSKNTVENLDTLELDFSLLKKENVQDGLNLSTSRGCHNNCFFCTIPHHKNYRAMSAKKMKSILNKYYIRLLELFGKEENFPRNCLKLAFNDDDFLGERERALNFFKYLKKTNFKIDFFQSSINSIFIKDSYDERIDKELIQSMSNKVFWNNQDYKIYIGTENFCSDELQRLGKNYNFKKVQRVTAALSKYKITHAHHLILTNIETTLDNIMENLLKASILKKKHGYYFNILLPVTPHLVSFYPSYSFKIFSRKYRYKYFNIRKTLISNSKKELNYPFVENDIPIDLDVREISNNAEKLIQERNAYISSIEKTLTLLSTRVQLLKKENKQNERIKKLQHIINKYRNFHDIINHNLRPENKKPPSTLHP